jgi:hypothetical protein
MDQKHIIRRSVESSEQASVTQHEGQKSSYNLW